MQFDQILHYNNNNNKNDEISMLSIRSIRRLCAVIDAVAITVIAANLRRRSNSDLAAADRHFPTIAACRAALTSTNKPEPANPQPAELPALLRIQAERDPEKIFNLLRSNSHNPIVVENRFVFEDAISRLSGARRLDLIENLLEHHKSLPQGRREGFIVRIIGLYGRAGMPDHALKTFDEMHLFACPRSVKSLNAVVKVLCDSRRFGDACRVFDEMPVKFGIELDGISYNTIIKGFLEMGMLEKAGLVMAEMDKKGISPDVVTYTTLISAAYKFGRREIGDGLWNLMVLKGCMPNLATFNVRVQYLVNRRRGWQANDFVRKMKGVGMKPDELTYNMIIKGFCLMGELEMAKRVFFALQRGNCRANSRIYQTMIHYLCKAGDYVLAFKFCKESMEKNWFPSLGSIDNLLKGLISISKDKEAGKILKLVNGKQPPYPANILKALEAIVSNKEMKV